MKTFASLATAAVLAAAPALAQIPPPSPRQGDTSVGTTSTGPLAPRATTGVGQTKPPGAAEGGGLGTRPDLEAKSRELDRKIDTGICTGCN